MEYTGKSKRIVLLGQQITFQNQRCRDWTHPYPYQPNDGANLANSGCGVFGLCHCVEWLTGKALNPEDVADFSCANGGRGDDGTDRPGLLHGVMAAGLGEAWGFRYDEDGLRNDLDSLWTLLSEERGVALCNLRVGHIVALVAAREQRGERQLLAVDSYSESADQRVRDSVCELVPGSEVLWPVRNEQGLIVGKCESSGAFWVQADLPRDFNLLHRR